MNYKTKKLNKQNNRLDKQIATENQAAFTDMICYLRGANISEYDIEVVRQDLTEMVISAQQRGDNIDSVIGNDYKQFCDAVIESLPPKTMKQKIVDAINMICWSLSILFTINIVISEDTISIIKNLFKKNDVDWSIAVSMGTLISMAFIVLAAYIIVELVMKHAFGKEQHHSKLLGALIGAGFMCVLLVIALLGKDTLFTINLIIACAITIALYISHKLLDLI